MSFTTTKGITAAGGEVVLYMVNGIGVGVLHRKDNIFRKQVNKSIHLMRIYDAWGIDAGIFDSLPSEGSIRILDKEENIVYAVSVAQAKETAKREHFTEGNKDHGEQVFIPRTSFVQEKGPASGKKTKVKNQKYDYVEAYQAGKEIWNALPGSKII
jgi:hypothetical protein